MENVADLLCKTRTESEHHQVAELDKTEAESFVFQPPAFVFHIPVNPSCSFQFNSVHPFVVMSQEVVLRGGQSGTLYEECLSSGPNWLFFLSALVLRGFLLLSLQPPSSLMGFCMAAVTSLALTYSVSSLTSNRRISGTLNKTTPSGRRGFVFRAPR